MALPPLATTADLTLFGYPDDVPASVLERASARVRRYTRQDISPGTSTVELFGPPFRLPQRPVREVTAVTGTSSWTLHPAGVLEIAGCGPITVTYDHGFDELPDDLVELVCQIATRLHSTPDAIQTGARTEQAGGESVTWGVEAYAASTGLTTEEKSGLDKLFPKLPKTAILL